MFSFAHFDKHNVITDAKCTVSENWFVAQSCITKTVDATGAEIAYDYDENSTIVAIIDTLGNMGNKRAYAFSPLAVCRKL